MADKENPADHNAKRRDAMYKDEPKKGGAKQKTEETPTKEAESKGGTSDKGDKESSPLKDTQARHKRERDDTNKRHGKEREDMSDRHEGEHGDMAKRHDKEMEEAMMAAASPNSGTEKPAGAVEADNSAGGANDTPAAAGA